MGRILRQRILEKLAYSTRNLGYVQFIVRTDHTMRLTCLSEQLVQSSEQLVLMDTKRGFIRPWDWVESGACLNLQSASLDILT